MSKSKKYNRELKEYEDNRFEQLKQLYYQVNSERYDWRIVNEKSKETLQDISCSWWRYQQVLKYYQDKLKQKRENEKEIENVFIKEINEKLHEDIVFIDTLINEEIEINEVWEDNLNQNQVDINKAKEQFNNCLKLMESRNKKYWNSWKKLRISSIVDLMIMKLDRCQKQELDNKAIEIELEDIVNYWIFWLMNLRNGKK